MKEELNVVQQQYKANKMQVAEKDFAVCSKCDCWIERNDKYYRSVETGKPAHVTCHPRKEARK